MDLHCLVLLTLTVFVLFIHPLLSTSGAGFCLVARFVCTGKHISKYSLFAYRVGAFLVRHKPSGLLAFITNHYKLFAIMKAGSCMLLKHWVIIT